MHTNRTAFLTMVMCAFARIASAQETAHPHVSGFAWSAGSPVQDVGIVMGAVEIGGQAVKDAPYSADEVAETVRVLADGTRIRQSSTAAIHRDSRGRTRREQGLAVIGPLVAGGEAAKQVVITDPEAGVSYLLDVARKKAFRMPTPSFAFSQSGASGSVTVSQSSSFTVFSGSAAGHTGSATALSLPAVSSATGGIHASGTGRGGRREELGTQVMDNISVEGSRTTSTIPAGQIGNDRDIAIVSERWVSPHLKTLVKSRETNPMFGDTSFELKNVVLAEPSAALFEVPADFEVVNGTSGNRIDLRRRQP